MRVLLVYANQARDLLPPPPVGLAYVAQAARRAGHEVAVVDLLAARSPEVALAAALRRVAPEVVGVSVRSLDNVVAQRPASHIASVAANLAVIRRETAAPIVLGGPAISILGAEALRALDADFAIVGEGEEVFPALLAELASGQRFERVDGLCYRLGGQVVARAPARLATFSASSLEEWIDWQFYERHGSTWPVQTKRGCPLGCVYCGYPRIEGECHRLREVGDVVDEIQRVARTISPRTFEIVDATFNVPMAHAVALCEEIIRRDLRVRLTATTINPVAASRELFTAMKRAGFISMMVTPEAASDRTLAGLGKGYGRDEVVRTALLVRESGIPSAWFFLLGGPGETRETAEETVSFIEEFLSFPGTLVIVTTGVRVLPGTALAERAVAEGVVARGTTLVEPVFYLSREVSERWLLERVNRAIRNHPNVVHTAEEGGGPTGGLFERSLSALGVAPPYWRFLPRLLALPPLRAVRGRTVEF